MKKTSVLLFGISLICTQIAQANCKATFTGLDYGQDNKIYMDKVLKLSLACKTKVEPQVTKSQLQACMYQELTKLANNQDYMAIQALALISCQQGDLAQAKKWLMQMEQTEAPPVIKHWALETANKL